jgi:glycosyltransferase involved in cell wall biosynthesis
MKITGQRLHIGIISHCDLYSLRDYLFDEYKETIPQTPNYATAVTNLIRGLLDNDIKITIFTLSSTLPESCCKGNNLNIYIIPSQTSYPWKYLWGCWRNALKLKKAIRINLEGIDLLHAHWTYEYAWAAGNFTHQLPVVCSVRDIASYIWKSATIKNKIVWTSKVVMNFFVFKNKKIHFLANSQYTSDEIMKTWKVSAPVIPNSVNPKFLTHRNLQPLHPFIIVSITQNIDKRKNILTLLKAFQKFRIDKEVELWLVGGMFVPKNPIIQDWNQQGLLKSVILKGSLDNTKLITLLDKCSLMVHPSLEETFGNTLIEAMARKVPVIGGINSGAVPYVLGGGNFGILADINYAEDLNQKMEFAYRNRTQLNETTDKAYQQIKNNYAISSVVKKHIEYYSLLIN